MDSSLIILISLILAGFGGLAALFWYFSERRIKNQAVIDPQALLFVRERLEKLDEQVRSSLTETFKQQQTSSQHMTSAVRDVTERLTKVEECSRQAFNETARQVSNFTGQIENLQRILTNPKQRGIVGEYYLETLLNNVFGPEQFQMQFSFADGTIVDAALFVRDKIVPIDSKFSLENYNRLQLCQNDEEKKVYERAFVNDLKTRVKETAKYVRPEEGTMDFAFMFIPHEAIYYDLLINKVGEVGEDTESILQRAALAHHVLIVSPTSLTAYLQTVLQGLKALKIEEQAKEIKKRVSELGRHLSVYQEKHESVGRALGVAVNQYNLAGKEFAKIDKDVLRISGENAGLAPSLAEGGAERSPAELRDVEKPEENT